MRTLIPTLLLLAACTSGSGKSAPDDSGPGGDDGGDGGDDGGDGGGDDGGDTDPVAENLRSASGDFALDFLTAETYDRVVLEVDWVAGNEPDPDALDAVAAAIEALGFKPGGVDIVLDDEVPPQGSPSWTYEAAEDMELAWRDRYRDPDTGTAVLYLLYLDGTSALDSGGGYIIAYAYHGSSVIVFDERVAQASGGLGLLGSVEDTVLVHEVGHILGLVNNGVPMVADHQDTAHGQHDSDDGCIMYWAVETDAIGDILGTHVPDFDAACRADLAAAGGRDTTR